MSPRPSSTSCPSTHISAKINAGRVSLWSSVLPIKPLWWDLRRQLPSRVSKGFYDPPNPPCPEPIITLWIRQGSKPSSPQTRCQRYKRKVRTGFAAALNVTIVGAWWLVDDLRCSKVVKNGLRCGFSREHNVPGTIPQLRSLNLFTKAAAFVGMWISSNSLNVTILSPANGDNHNIQH